MFFITGYRILELSCLHLTKCEPSDGVIMNLITFSTNRNSSTRVIASRLLGSSVLGTKSRVLKIRLSSTTKVLMHSHVKGCSFTRGLDKLRIY